MSAITNKPYQNLNVYFGDIHNHCDLSYGHGTLNEALKNARQQLDFVSITVHAVWPDLPTDDPKLAYLVDYHKEGFIRAEANWQDYLEAIEQANHDGKFVTFPSFEWHSIAYGDYCVYYNNTTDKPDIIDAPDLPTLRAKVQAQGISALLIPHHIGYKQGSRGINWQAFDNSMSPVAEIFSFHGLSESSEGAYPYLHSMGPRHEHSTAQYGWLQGNIFGIIGSTDHHNAFPGSYGYGRMGVWAENLSREAIWNAIQNRRTYALTGDNINLKFSLNGLPIGSIAPPTSERNIDIAVEAGDMIDSIDILHNNHIIHRENIFPTRIEEGRFKIHVELGWGEQEQAYDWDMLLRIENGKLHGAESRLQGISPTANGNKNGNYAYNTFDVNDSSVHLITQTYRNRSLHTSATEGFVIEIEGTTETCLRATMNGQEESIKLGDLLTGARTFYMGGFVSPVICFHRAAPKATYQHKFSFQHTQLSTERDWYYIRVRQQNNQYAWSSPIWVTGST